LRYNTESPTRLRAYDGEELRDGMEERESGVREGVDVCQEDENHELCPAATEIVVRVNLAPDEGAGRVVD
jgi:hypothetical protein